MSDLRRRLLKDLVREVKPGFACGEVDPSGIFQVRMNNVTKSGDIDLSKQRRVPRNHPGIDRNKLLSGDVLFNATNSPELVGKTLFWSGLDEEAVYSNHFQRIRTDGDKLDPEYLSRWLSRQFESGIFRGLCKQWVNQATVSKESLLALRVPLPPLLEQKRIAAVLGQVDTLRAKRREAIGLLNDLAQSIFLDMFGDLTGSVRLADFAEVQGGLQLSGARDSKPLEVPYLRVANVHRGYLRLDEIKTLRATPQEIERTRLVKGDLLVVEGHGNPNEIGRAALWDGSIDACTHQNHLIRIRVDSQYLIPEYVEMYLNSAVGRRHLLSSANTTSGLNTISTGAVKENPIAVPDMGRQHAFLSRLNRLQKVKQRHLTHLATLDELFTSLQHRAFSGTLWDHEATGEAA